MPTESNRATQHAQEELLQFFEGFWGGAGGARQDRGGDVKQKDQKRAKKWDRANTTTLHCAAQGGFDTVVHTLVSASEHKEIYLKKSDNHGYCALHWAAWEGKES